MESSIVGIEEMYHPQKDWGPATNYLIQLLRESGDREKTASITKMLCLTARVLRSSTNLHQETMTEKSLVRSVSNQDLSRFYGDQPAALSGWWSLRVSSMKFQRTCFTGYFEVMEAMVRSELALVNKPVA